MRTSGVQCNPLSVLQNRRACPLTDLREMGIMPILPGQAGWAMPFDRLKSRYVGRIPARLFLKHTALSCHTP
jgi:hypothetical protein